ncbi:MAG TPA: M13 family metallopeptidase [Steroidobacteraceae bacterium]|nr:M13 family metallopeptidase [Steroidobacteraceae bacterium]
MNRTTAFLGPLVLSLASTQAATPPAQYGSFGLDLTAQDKSVKPGDDFYEYTNGHWLKTQAIPADRARWGTFDQLGEQADERVRKLIQALPEHAPAGSIEQKVGDYYRAFLDRGAIDAAGLKPAQPALTAIAAAQTPEDIATLMGRPDLGLKSPVGVGITIDAKNPDRYLTVIVQSGLGLPDRDYYLKQDPKFVEIRAQYRSHLEKMLSLAGVTDTAAKAGQILELETKVADCHWPRAKLRERDLTYNLRTLAEVEQLAPAFPWKSLLAAQELQDRKEFNVAQPDAVQKLATLFTQTPVDVWKSYLEVHYLDAFAAVLPTPFDDESFDFFGRKLNGQQEQRERWKRAVAAVNSELGEAVGELYVREYFPPAAKAQALALVENLRKAYEKRFAQVPWMTPATRKVALEKLATFRPKIGYPDKWRDYSSLEVRPGEALGNQVRAEVFEWQREVKRIDQPTDRDEWEMTPQTVNAYYNPVFNEIVFPAAILQPPYFDPKADPAVNYGAIGGVIGHEMGHGFDDQGAKSDAKGVLRTWWLPEDTAAFKKLGDALAAQYDSYVAVDDLHVNGRLTLGENIGDLSGMTVAYDAYHLALHGEKAPVLAGLTGDQRFFMAWAQGWRTLIRDERLRNQVMTDPHSPAPFRVNGVVRNVDGWYKAFNVKPGDKLYLPPDKRVHIW